MKNKQKVFLVLAICFVLYFLIPLFATLLTVAAIVFVVLWSIDVYKKNFGEEQSHANRHK